MALESSDLTLQVSGDAIDKTPDAWEAELLCSAWAQRGRSCKGCHLWLRETWTSASHPARLAVSLQLQLAEPGTALHSEPGAAVCSTAAGDLSTRSSQTRYPREDGWSLVVAGCKSRGGNLLGCYLTLESPLGKVQATTARLQGLLALGACQP